MMMWAAALGRMAGGCLAGPALATLGPFTLLLSANLGVVDATLAEAGRGRCGVDLVLKSEGKKKRKYFYAVTPCICAHTCVGVLRKKKEESISTQ